MIELAERERDMETVITAELCMFKKPKGAWDMLCRDMRHTRKSQVKVSKG